MMRKRGRPKGAEQTVIGLPRKKRRGNKPLPFLKKSPSDKEKGINLSVYTIVINSVHMYVVILMWFLSPQIANAAISGKIVQKEEVNLTQLVPASCLDDNICIETCRKYFTHSAWEEIKKVVDEMKNHPVWYCGRCMLPIRDYIESSIICDCCLNWFHFTCVNLKKSPKSKNWFCRPCHNISKV